VLGGLALLVLRRQGRQAIGRAARSHPGLVLVCVCLTLFALSNRVYAGSLLLVSLPKPPGADIFRVSGRFFWPVAYALLVGMVAALAAMRGRRLSLPALVAIAALQTADARSLWLLDCVNLRVAPIQTLDTGSLRQAMTRSRTLSVYPAWPCHATRTGALDLMDVLNVADSVLIPVETMYTARPSHAPDCDPATTLEAPLAAGELRVVLPDEAAQLGRVPQAGRFCRMNGRFGVCTRGAS
jgi:hypothetical protein